MSEKIRNPLLNFDGKNIKLSGIYAEDVLSSLGKIINNIILNIISKKYNLIRKNENHACAHFKHGDYTYLIILKRSSLVVHLEVQVDPTILEVRKIFHAIISEEGERQLYYKLSHAIICARVKQNKPSGKTTIKNKSAAISKIIASGAFE